MAAGPFPHCPTFLHPEAPSQPASICTYHQASQGPFPPSVQSFLSNESIYSTIEPVEIWPLDLCFPDKILRGRVLKLAERASYQSREFRANGLGEPLRPAPCFCASQHVPKHSCGKAGNLRQHEELRGCALSCAVLLRCSATRVYGRCVCDCQTHSEHLLQLICLSEPG